jgi:hypothetical protein
MATKQQIVSLIASLLSVTMVASLLLSVPASVRQSQPRLSTSLPVLPASSPSSDVSSSHDVGSNRSLRIPQVTHTADQLPKVAVVVPPSSAVPHAVYRYHALFTPNDPSFSSQTHLTSIGATTAWNSTTGNSANTIAIIDTGFALDHTDFAGRWYTNPGEIGPTTSEGPAPNCTSRGLKLDKSCNNLDNDGDGLASDWRGWNFSAGNNTPQAGATAPTSTAAFHGTFVAGLAAATGNNATGGAGIDWQARIMPLQALDDTGAGDTNTVAAAVQYAADHGAKVINMSLGSPSDDAYLHQMIDYAIGKGAVVVAASGNDGCNNCVSYPAAYPEVLAVGAANADGSRASFSSYGPQVDLLAPGVDLCATLWTSSNATTGFGCGGSGTSFSTPIVSGSVSLLIAAGITSPDLAKQYLILSASKAAAMGQAVRTDEYGFGNISLIAALSAFSAPPEGIKAASVVKVSCFSATSPCANNFMNANGVSISVSNKNSSLGAVDSQFISADTFSAGVYVPVSPTGSVVSGSVPLTINP